MNAIQALNLRKSEPARNHVASSFHSETNSRFGKRSNMKEILIRNFFRKFPISNDISDIEQLHMERTVASEMDTFVLHNAPINSKNLHEFETQLAQQIGLKRRSGEVGQPLSH